FVTSFREACYGLLQIGRPSQPSQAASVWASYVGVGCSRRQFVGCTGRWRGGGVGETDVPPRPEGVHPPVFSALRQSKVVSSTSEEEEALTEKFLKINCKYITDGMGAVSGVLLVTPNNIMFDPHRMDPLVQTHGCEEYGIMCPLEEVQSAAICKEITDPVIREAVPE
ncbi:oxidation resistance protein 1, partial [Xenoophorus captivus]